MIELAAIWTLKELEIRIMEHLPGGTCKESPNKGVFTGIS